MANQYDTNLKLQAIADAIGNSGSSGLIQALEDIADAVAGGGGGGSSTAGLVSDNFSETDTYDLGDYCIHNNTLYVCINAITTPGPWDLSDWQATNAGIQLSSLNSALTSQVIIPSPAPANVTLNTLRKRANIIQVNLRYATITPSSNGWVILGNLPADFLNADVVDLIVPDNTSNTEYKSVICRIEADGTIRMWGIANKGVQPCLSATFIGK